MKNTQSQKKTAKTAKNSGFFFCLFLKQFKSPIQAFSSNDEFI